MGQPVIIPVSRLACEPVASNAGRFSGSQANRLTADLRRCSRLRNASDRRNMQFYEQRATVMGLGRHGGGAGAARYLAQHGARVTVTDLAAASDLASSLDELAGTPIERFHLSGHCEADFTDANLIVVNPAVRPDNRFVALAQAAGARITSEIEMFLAACPAHVIGVTGTTGKSTTAAMIAAALDASGQRAWLGGNIGGSLLVDLDRMTPNDWVVLELSSFQLYWLSENVRWPELGVLTNFAPNHLDWHGSVEHYRQAKQRLLDNVGQAFQPDSQARKPDLRSSIDSWPDSDVPMLKVPGRHNRSNAAVAAAVASAAGADRPINHPRPGGIHRPAAPLAGRHRNRRTLVHQ